MGRYPCAKGAETEGMRPAVLRKFWLQRLPNLAPEAPLQPKEIHEYSPRCRGIFQKIGWVIFVITRPSHGMSVGTCLRTRVRSVWLCTRRGAAKTKSLCDGCGDNNSSSARDGTFSATWREENGAAYLLRLNHFLYAKTGPWPYKEYQIGLMEHAPI